MKLNLKHPTNVRQRYECSYDIRAQFKLIFYTQNEAENVMYHQGIPSYLLEHFATEIKQMNTWQKFSQHDDTAVIQKLCNTESMLKQLNLACYIQKANLQHFEQIRELVQSVPQTYKLGEDNLIYNFELHVSQPEMWLQMIEYIQPGFCFVNQLLNNIDTLQLAKWIITNTNLQTNVTSVQNVTNLYFNNVEHQANIKPFVKWLIANCPERLDKLGLFESIALVDEEFRDWIYKQGLLTFQDLLKYTNGIFAPYEDSLNELSN